MATATQPRNGPAPTRTAPSPDQDFGDLLNDVIDRTPVAERPQAIEGELLRHVGRLETLLPPALKGQGERLVRRAMLTFGQRKELRDIRPTSFMRCVLQAAELGLAIDGRLAHAVPYKGEATLQLDYKGVTAVARRSGVIADVYARLVHEKDQLRLWHEDGKDHLFHEPHLAGEPGAVLGAFAVVKLPGGDWHYEWMRRDEIERVRAASRSGNAGPWAQWYGEMAKKTVVKRALKNYQEDPALSRALEIDDQDTLLDRIAGQSPPHGVKAPHAAAEGPGYEPALSDPIDPIGPDAQQWLKKHLTGRGQEYVDRLLAVLGLPSFGKIPTGWWALVEDLVQQLRTADELQVWCRDYLDGDSVNDLPEEEVDQIFRKWQGAR